jgi:monovalent cation/hydrogen antiporter
VSEGATCDSEPVAAEVPIVALLLVAAIVAGISTRLGFSSPLVLTGVGIVGSFVPGIPEYPLSPELVLAGFLPPLLYSAAIRTPFVDIRRNRRQIALLSVGLVLVTALAVAGVAVLLLPELPVAAAVALGAVVAPPDAVAATTVARRVGMPRRIVTILEGESLLNDATALVTFRTALGALAGTASLLGAGFDFGRAIVVGVGVGVLVAQVVTPVRRRVGDPVLDTTLSLLVPYVAYLAAEELHGSGVLAVVVAGLVLGHRSPEIQSAQSRVTERILWRTVQFVLENVVFLLIGLQLRGLVEKARASAVDNHRIALLCLGVTAAVVVVRIAWMFPAVLLPRLVPAIRRAEPVPPWRHVVILSWAGMRGVVTLAAGFALVGQVRYGEVLVIAAFSVVAATLLLQGSTLPGLVRLLNVPGPDPAQDALQQALVLQRAVDAGMHRLDQEADDDTPKDIVEDLRSWSERVAHSVWERLGTSDGRSETPSRAFRRLRVAMLQAERGKVVDVYRSGKVPAEVLDGVLERLDQEEAMLVAFGEGAATGHGDLLTPHGVEECDHLRSEPLVAVPGNPDGCEDCLAMGEHAWVSLRMCLRCGRVGCCDSSPRRHATAHYQRVAHPVIRSIELGEGWRWCYVDQIVG